MKLQQVSENCVAVLNEKNLVCDANSGLIDQGGGGVIDTQSDLPHGQQMIELFGKVWRGMPKRVVNMHEDGDHVWGNQPGPYLVTADEVGDPYALQVVVKVDGQVRYQGTTAEIDHKAEDVFAWLGFISSIRPGSVMGFGTIPDCTGLDRDDFIDTGAEIEISFERLGTLRCRFPEPAGKLLPSRWPVRPALQKFHGHSAAHRRTPGRTTQVSSGETGP
jgi:glyoxylase-like metal-dependent hydrolase (beta-lactamase superfamily II)